MRQPVGDMARSAAELVLRRLGEDASATPSTVVFQAELLVRGSVRQLDEARAVGAP